jgi:transcription antitermination factor NusB
VADRSTVDLASALASAGESDDDLAALARRVAEEDGTARLREAAELLFAAEEGKESGVASPGAAVLFRIRRMLRRDDILSVLFEAELGGRALEVGSLDERGAATAEAVWAERLDLDRAVGEVATKWRVQRMAAVDRNVLRLGLWELRHRPELSTGVIVSEAVRLAKAYSTAQSGPFVNGILGSLAVRERGDV